MEPSAWSIFWKAPDASVADKEEAADAEKSTEVNEANDV